MSLSHILTRYNLTTTVSIGLHKLQKKTKNNAIVMF